MMKKWVFRIGIALAVFCAVVLQPVPVKAANDRYWVGNSGNWTDTAHWSLASGGAGGASVPGTTNDVHFDANSFTVANQTVNLNTGTINCAVLDTVGSGIDTPVFVHTVASSITWSIYGNVTIENGWTMVENGSYRVTWAFRSNLNLTTATDTIKFFHNQINASGATVTLASNWYCRDFTWTVGTFAMGAFNLTCQGSFAGGGQTYGNTVILTLTDGNAGESMTGANTFNNLTVTQDHKDDSISLAADITVSGTFTADGTSATNRLLIQSSTPPTQRTITAVTVVSEYADYYAIVGAGAGDWDLSDPAEDSIGFPDCSGITFGVPYDATRNLYWTGLQDGVAGAGEWDDYYNWSTTSGGAAGAPRHFYPSPTNNVYFDANSGFTVGNTLVTVTGFWGGDYACVFKNIDFTGSGAVATPQIKSTSDGASRDVRAYGDVTLIAGMTDVFGYTGTTTTKVYLKGSGTFTSNGADIGSLDFIADCSGTYTLGTDLTLSRGTWTYTSGTVNTNGKWINVQTAGTFAGGGKTYYGLMMTGTGTHTITGSNIFTNLYRQGGDSYTSGLSFAADQYITNLDWHGFNGVKRLQVGSSVAGTQRQISVNGIIDVTNCDISDIAGVGTPTAPGWDISAGFNTDMGGNLGITFTTGINLYWVGNTGNWSDVTNHWSITSGGTPGGAGARVPLLQDTAVFDSKSFSIPGRVVTIDITRLSGINAEDVTNTPTITKSGTVEVYGDVILGSVIWTPTSTYFKGLDTGLVSSSVLTTNFYAQKSSYYMASLILGSNVEVAGTIYVSSGIFNHNGWDVTADFYDSSTTTYARAIRLGGGTLTLDGTTATTKWNMATTNLNLYCESSTIILTNSTANTQTFASASLTYNNVMIAGAGAYQVTISGSPVMYEFKIDRSLANKTISGAITITLSSFVMEISGTRTITISGPDFVKATGVVLGDYLVISNSAASGGATFFASVGGHSTNGGGNSGWIWTPPIAPTVQTVAASDVTEAGATLNGELLTAGSYVSFLCYFEYGPTIAYGWETDGTTLTGTGVFDDRVTPFHPYHYRAVVEFGLNDHVYGNDMVVTLVGGVKQAKSAVSDVGAEPGDVLVSSAPDPIPYMYDEGETGGIPIAPLIDPALSGADLPKAAFWYPIAFAVAILVGFAAYGFTRNLLAQCLASGLTMAAFCGGGVLGQGLLPYLTVVVFVIEGVLVILIQEKHTI